MVDFVNPPQAVVINTPKIEPVTLGGDEQSTLSQLGQASQEAIATPFRRGRRRKTNE